MLEEIVAIVMVFGTGMVAFVAFSPIGRAIGERIRGAPVAAPPDPELMAEVDQLRHDVMELQERVDFTERLLARHRDEGRLPGGNP
jgi:hypothetical protein